MAVRASGTLTGDVVTSETITVPADSTVQYTDGTGASRDKVINNRANGLTVTNVGGQGAIYFTVDGSTPTVGGEDCYVVAAAAGSLKSVSVLIEDAVTVKMISPEAAQYSVDFGTTTSGSSSSSGGSSAAFIWWGVPGPVTTVVGTSRVYLPGASGGTIDNVHLSCADPTDSGTVDVNVQLNGTDIFTTDPTIGTGGVAASNTPDTTSYSAGDYLTFDVNAAGDSAADLMFRVDITVS